MRLLFRFLISALVFFGLGFALFVWAFHWPRLSAQPIVFYRGIGAALCAAAVQAVLAAIFGRRFLKGWLVSGVSLTLAFNVTFLIVFPVTFDRSVTTFLLARLSSKPEGLTHEELQRTLTEEYVTAQDASGRRMAEQIGSGNIERQGERYALTAQGRRFIEFARLLCRVFGIPLSGEKEHRTEAAGK